MPLAALVMVLLVISVMLPLMVVATLWPDALARLNAAALRTLPVAAPQSMREQAASNSTPGTMRFTGVVGLGIILVISVNVVRTVLDHGLEDVTPEASAWIAWPVYAIGVAQALFGIIVVLRSRQIFDRLRTKFDASGAQLRRWMVVVLGAVALCMGATSLLVAISLN